MTTEQEARPIECTVCGAEYVDPHPGKTGFTRRKYQEGWRIRELPGAIPGLPGSLHNVCPDCAQDGDL